jgi:hypothetical protein
MCPKLRIAAVCIAALLGAAPAAVAADTAPPAATTNVADAGALARLEKNRGLTLQWISWERRGHLAVAETGGLVRLKGEQREKGGPGRLDVDGVVLAIDRDSFTFRGRIAMYAAPHDRKECIRDGTFVFRITGKRRYWRLQQMEACAGLTDYVDIYFSPAPAP